MNLNFVNDVFGRLVSITRKHAPEIMASMGIAGFVTTAVMAVKATPEAMELIEEKKKEENVDELSAVDTIKAAWKPYVPSVVTGVASTFCVVGSVSTSLRRTAVATTAYEMTRTYLNEYRNKVIETIGEKKEQRIQNAVIQDRIENNPPVQNINIVAPDDDGIIRQLYFEPITNDYILCTPAEINTRMAKCYEAMNNSFEDQLSAYTVVDILSDSKLIDIQTNSFVNLLMNEGWGRSYPNEGFSVEISKTPEPVLKGRWKGCSCFPIEYGYMPNLDFKAPY